MSDALPFRSIDTVFHVGSMQPEDKFAHGSSMEGTGLSVSLCPEGWRAIARLGALPTWQLSRPGGRFLDAHALSGAQKDRVLRWCAERGLVERGTLHVVRWVGGEEPEWRESWYADAADAQVEFEFLKDEAPDLDDPDAPVLLRRDGWLSTHALASRLTFEPPPMLTADLCLTIFAEDRADLGLDGVWWNDELDVPALSAPRGVIHRRALAGWTAALHQTPSPRRHKGFRAAGLA